MADQDMSYPTSPLLSAYECAICYDHLARPAAAIIQRKELCQDCFDAGIRPQFEVHLLDETAVPRWHRIEITIEDVEHQFDDAFVIGYQVKKYEYRILPKYRVYCAARVQGGPCGMFIDDKHYGGSQAVCPCGAKTCKICDSIIALPPQEHVCKTTANATLDAFSGQVRGVDYQLCPNCDMVVNLRDGCNHMTCQFPACNATEFCYICGEAATPEDGHWTKDRFCPRYGLPARLEESNRYNVTELSALKHIPTVSQAFRVVARVNTNLVREGAVPAGDLTARAAHPEAIAVWTYLEDTLTLATRALEKLPRAISQHPAVLEKRAAIAPAIRAVFQAGIAQDDIHALRRFPAIVEAEAALKETIEQLPKTQMLEDIIADLRRQSLSLSLVHTRVALDD
ncbi:Putative E3 ubiquitin ligase RBR family [Septoria linicola]|uniref:E3 ubiquitin ligase RBR family n=1 Tax=Septoria linicola TaxID=215465 RepID=A0A9Q9AMT3_9PEZI|nr:Putative E3 ubiquitin ligase RBR family [Septoria linicola]